MGDLLAKGSEMLDRTRRAHLSRTVVYRRGVDSVEIEATVGSTAFDRTDEYGVVHRIESRDYLVAAADLVLGGEAVTPKAGDRITETAEARVHEYEVMSSGSLGRDEPAWRYSDPQRRTLRIHTKFVRTGAA
ncbi:MAG: hypothetical protein AAFP26_10465 [Planctomycetota bacterium]